MNNLVEYGYILDNYRFGVPKKKNEYTAYFKDFDIALSFKNEMIDKIDADKIIHFLKTLNEIKK